MTREVFYIGGPDEAKHKAEWERLREAHRALDLSRPYKVVIELHRPKRSDAQNKLYQKWVGFIANETGNDRDDVKQVIIEKYCPWKTIVINGVEHQVRSTKYLDVKEMSDYMDKVMAWAGRELSIKLPLPEDRETENNS